MNKMRVQLLLMTGSMIKVNKDPNRKGENMCTYQDANGKPPCCTHDCDGCVWHKEDN